MFGKGVVLYCTSWNLGRCDVYPSLRAEPIKFPFAPVSYILFLLTFSALLPISFASRNIHFPIFICKRVPKFQEDPPSEEEEDPDEKEEVDGEAEHVWVYFKPDATHLGNGTNKRKKKSARTMRSGENGLFRCKHCGEELPSYPAYRQHRLEMHRDLLLGKSRSPAAGEFQCGECGKSFARRAVYETHVQRHGDPVTCQTCGKVCPNQPALYAHAQRLCFASPFFITL